MDDGAYTRSLLLKLASENPVIADTIRRVYHNKAYVEQNKVISFDSYSSRIWHSINKDYRSMRGSAKCEKAWDVFRDVESKIEEIGEQAGGGRTFFGTKKSGLETLRKIGKTIALSEDTIGHEVRKQFQTNTALEDAMWLIVGQMSEEECQQMCDGHDGRSTFLAKMEEMATSAKYYYLFEGLDGVIA